MVAKSQMCFFNPFDAEHRIIDVIEIFTKNYPQEPKMTPNFKKSENIFFEFSCELLNLELCFGIL